MDLAIDDVLIVNSEYKVSISNHGNYPVPIRLNVFYRDGTKKVLKKNVSVWQEGEPKFVLTFNEAKPVKFLKLDHYLIPDAKMDNNRWNSHQK